MKTFASIAHSFDEENTISPPEFMKWYQDNYNRMVQKGIRPPLGEEEICSGAFKSWMKIDVDNDGHITYDEFIAAIVKNEITNY